MLLCQRKQIYSEMRRLSQFNFYYPKEKETLSLECLSIDQSFTKTTYLIIMIFQILFMYVQTNNFKTLKLFCFLNFNVQYYITDCIIKNIVEHVTEMILRMTIIMHWCVVGQRLYVPPGLGTSLEYLQIWK